MKRLKRFIILMLSCYFELTTEQQKKPFWRTVPSQKHSFEFKNLTFPISMKMSITIKIPIKRMY